MRWCSVSEEAWWCCACCGSCWGRPRSRWFSLWPSRRWCSSCWSCESWRSWESAVFPRGSQPLPVMRGDYYYCWLTNCWLTNSWLTNSWLTDYVPEEDEGVSCGARRVWGRRWASSWQRGPTPDTAGWSLGREDRHSPSEQSAAPSTRGDLGVCLVETGRHWGPSCRQAAWWRCSTAGSLWRGQRVSILPPSNILHQLYLPFEDMKFFARFDWSSSFWGGIPKSSIIHDSWSPRE